MKSNEDNVTSTPQEKLQMSTLMLAHSTEQVAKAIDDLASASLKRVLKVVTHVHLADALLERPTWYANLNEKEQKVIEVIFEHQETTFGHQALKQEVEQLDQEETGIETTDLSADLSTSLEENNNE